MRPILSIRHDICTARASRTASIALALLASSTFGRQMSIARADTPIPAPPPDAKAPIKTPDDTEVETAALDETNLETDESNTGYWEGGKNRWFVSTADDIGYLYARPRVSFGYGRPFWKWIGIDANPQGSNRFLGAYAGLRATLPFLDFRLGARYVWAFQQYYLQPADSYHRIDFESQALTRSKYTTLEAELTGSIPLGPGSLLGIASGSYITGVPDGVYVYDEVLRVVAKPPYEWRLRGGYAVRLGTEGKISVGIVADVLGMPGRTSGTVFRAGLIAGAALSNHIEVIGSFVPPILSPDTIGVAGGDFAQLGVRYRWATGSPPEPDVTH
jgi:hypothetical protein